MLIKKPFNNYQEMCVLADLKDREKISKLFKEFIEDKNTN